MSKPTIAPVAWTPCPVDTTGWPEPTAPDIDGVPMTYCSDVVVTEYSGGVSPRPLELYVTQWTTRFGYDHWKVDIFEQGPPAGSAL